MANKRGNEEIKPRPIVLIEDFNILLVFFCYSILAFITLLDIFYNL